MRAYTNGNHHQLEATHHGPWLASPSVFVEIGSCEEYWPRKDAAAAWGVALGRVLGLDSSDGYAVDDDLSPEKSHTLIVGFGQGHYVPKCVDCARRAGVSVGHMIASYVRQKYEYANITDHHHPFLSLTDAWLDHYVFARPHSLAITFEGAQF